MLKFIGKGVCPAVAIGRVHILKHEEEKIRREKIENVEIEKARFERAKKRASAELEEIYEKALREVGEVSAEIFKIHKMMLEDEDFNESVKSIISYQRVNAEYAVTLTGENFSEMFASMDDQYMKARAIDVADVSKRLIACMKEGERGESRSLPPSVICADDLTPSETVLFDKEKILGFITAHGSANSHTAILARNMNVPAVIGVGDSFLLNVKEGDLVAIDGGTGEIFINPDGKTEEKIKKKAKDISDKRELLRNLKGKESVTLDGRRINLYANIASPDDIGAVLASDAEGIGLFRSEFLYLEKEDYPDLEEQFEAYKKILLSMAGRRVIIRTLDIGADKQVSYFNLKKEDNPALGLRALRLCLRRPEIFKTQLRALYSASPFGKLGIMFPMVTSVWEGKRALEICEEVKGELREKNIPFSSEVEVGIMIETPAAAIISDRLAPLFDFFSVGTNDLIQYTLACDRQNPELEEFCDPRHEAVLRLIEMSAKNAHKNGRWIGICGELASDTSLTRAFLEMGIDELSVSPSHLLRLRDKVRRTDLREKRQ